MKATRFIPALLIALLTLVPSDVSAGKKGRKYMMMMMKMKKRKKKKKGRSKVSCTTVHGYVNDESEKLDLMEDVSIIASHIPRWGGRASSRILPILEETVEFRRPPWLGGGIDVSYLYYYQTGCLPAGKWIIRPIFGDNDCWGTWSTPEKRVYKVKSKKEITDADFSIDCWTYHRGD